MASASEEVWVLGIHMTKFGKHPDLDTVDLAAAGGAGRAGRRRRDHEGHGRHRRRQPHGRRTADRAGAPEAARPDRHPRLQRVQRLRHRRHRAAGGRAWRSRRARPTWAWPSASRSWPAPGCWPAGAARATTTPGPPRGATGRSPAIDGRIGTETMPGVFAQIGMEYGHRYGGTSFELFAKISEKNHSHSTLNPLAAYTKKMTLDEIMNDVMIAYPNTRPMCSANCDGAAAAVVVSGSKLKTLSLEQQKRAVKISASILTTDPWEEACQILPNVNDLTRNAAAQAYEQAGVGPAGPQPGGAARLLRHRRAGALRQPRALRARRRGRTSSSPAPPGATARPRSTCPAASSPRATRSRPPASPTSGRWPRTCAARPATARSRAPRSA